jgi:hypothetical protein
MLYSLWLSEIEKNGMRSIVQFLAQHFLPQKIVNINTVLLCFGICILIIGCGEEPLKVGVANWQPKCASGTIEIRPLPPAHLIQLDYQDWLKRETTAVVRVYSAVLQHKYRQSDYVVNIDKGDTPFGSQYFTAATFTYFDSAFGQYQMEWSRRGKHCPDFLKIDDRPRVFWFQLIDASYDLKCPRLSIVAIQDVEADHVLIANPVGTSSRRF